MRRATRQTRFLVTVGGEGQGKPEVLEFHRTVDFREWAFMNIKSLKESEPHKGFLRDGRWFVAVKGKAAEVLSSGKVDLK